MPRFDDTRRLSRTRRCPLILLLLFLPQFVRLKHIVVTVLKTRYNVEVDNLTSGEVATHPSFVNIDAGMQALLEPIMFIVDHAASNPSSMPSFLVIDPVCASVVPSSRMCVPSS